MTAYGEVDVHSSIHSGTQYEINWAVSFTARQIKIKKSRFSSLLNGSLGGPQCLSELFRGDTNLFPILGTEPGFPTFNPYRRHYAGYTIQNVVLNIISSSKIPLLPFSCNCRMLTVTFIYVSYENCFIIAINPIFLVSSIHSDVQSPFTL
jgi:hypothetical protein